MPKVPTYRTPERDDIVRREWEAGKPRTIIAETVNATSGPPVTPEQVERYAGNIGAKRPKWFFSAVQKGRPHQVPREMSAVAVPLEGVRIPLPDVIDWARNNEIKEGGLAAINDRRLKFGLPPFIPTRPRVKHEPFPKIKVLDRKKSRT